MSDGIMTDDFYVVAIVILLPVMASLLVFQSNPYQALVIRGILGAIAALVYALFGAADVALTEALVGTMLSITLYAVAVRSSMSMRLGIFIPEAITPEAVTPEAIDSTPSPLQKLEFKREIVEYKNNGDRWQPHPIPDQDYEVSYQPLFKVLRTCLNAHYLRLEIVPYPTLEDLHLALAHKEVQTICIASGLENPEYQLQTRLGRLYEILQGEIPPTIATLTYQEFPLSPPESKIPNSEIVEAS